MLEIRGLSAGYGEKPVLKELSFTAREGEVTVLAGPNGCGKSTLLRVIAGLHPAAPGSILLDGKDLLSVRGRERAQYAAYLAQDRQIPDISALRMVLHGRFPYLDYPRHYREEDLRIAKAAMERVGLDGMEDVPVATLSGGTRQKVYIAMALAQDTPVLLLDEPTTFLDAAHQLQLMETVRELAKEGKTVVMVLHDLTAAMRYADRIAVMEQGRMIQTGTPAQIEASGCIGQVFGVQLHRIETPHGVRYYCETGE